MKKKASVAGKQSVGEQIWLHIKFSRMNSPVLERDQKRIKQKPKAQNFFQNILSSVDHKKRQSRFSARVAPFVAPKKARYRSGIPFPTQLSVSVLPLSSESVQAVGRTLTAEPKYFPQLWGSRPPTLRYQELHGTIIAVVFFVSVISRRDQSENGKFPKIY